MPAIQTRNADMQLLGGADHLRALDRNFIFEAYHNSSNSFTATTVLGLDTQRLNHAPEYFVLASNILTIEEAGVYLFNVRTTLTITGGAAGQAAIALEQDPATGTFTTVLSGLCYVYIPPALNASMQLVVPLLVGENYRYRITGIRTSGSGTVQTLSQTTTLSALLMYNNT
jgi:hypothetical protein